jgi:hypothetical protein
MAQTTRSKGHKDAGGMGTQLIKKLLQSHLKLGGSAHDGAVVGRDKEADDAAPGGVDARVKGHEVGVERQRVTGGHRHLIHAVMVLAQAPGRQGCRVQRLQSPLAPQLHTPIPIRQGGLYLDSRVWSPCFQAINPSLSNKNCLLNAEALQLQWPSWPKPTIIVLPS